MLAVACGARTGLTLLEPSADDGSGPADADVAPDVTPEATTDAPFDAPPDAPLDVVDAPFDAPPPICEDGGVTYIYVLTEENALYSYYPPTNSFTFINTIDCPTTTETPYSMAVDRGGTAYSVFTAGDLFKINTANGACVGTSFVPDQQGFLTFGMGFSADTNDPGETLFVAEADFTGPSQGLGSIDTTTLALSFIGPFSSTLGRSELTGTADGRLFTFSLDNPGPGSHLSEIDKTNAQVLSSTALALGDAEDAFAYAFWGGSFYLFTGPGGMSTVTLFDPSTQALEQINTLDDTIVGAGVSTCAPK